MESIQAPITVMQRVEWKFILSARQTDFFCKRIEGHMEPDAYGLTTIQSLYSDTPNRRLVRTSIEKPEFKEKIRLRAYGRATSETPVYLELKRKAFGIVYKRRVQATVPEVERFFASELDLDEQGQIDREITYFRDYYQKLEPACMILYDRTAYDEPGGDLRLTVDRNPAIDSMRFPSVMHRSGSRFWSRGKRSLKSRYRIRSRCGSSAFCPKERSATGASVNTARRTDRKRSAENE